MTSDDVDDVENRDETPDQTTPERESKVGDEPDVFLDVPVLRVEELDLELDDLRAHISLRTELAGFVKVNVGIDAYLNHVKLGIKGVDAQAKLTVRLDRILDTFNRALSTMDNNPELVQELLRSAGSGALEDLFSEEESERPEESEGAAGTWNDDPEDPGVVVETRLNDSGDVVEETFTGGGSSAEDATRSARRKAEESNLDLAGVRGSGSGGRVLVRDVEKALRERG